MNALSLAFRNRISMTVYDLWLPILTTGLATHIMSTLAWMVMPHHKSDWQGLPVEDELLDLVEQNSVPPGQYLYPYADKPEMMKSEEYQKNMARCRGTVTVWEKPPNMGLAIGQTIAFFMIAAFCIGYLASLALLPGAEFMKVFQFTMTAGLLAHCAGIFPGVFWFKRKIAMDLIDKVAYALVTGLVFAALWPGA